VIARWLARKPRILIMDGADARHRRRREGGSSALMHTLAREGVAIIMISSELPEVLAMSDRIRRHARGRARRRVVAIRGDGGASRRDDDRKSCSRRCGACLNPSRTRPMAQESPKLVISAAAGRGTRARTAARCSGATAR
jgi:ABC-type nitrate/sulfonate/bicarbonate transport system ATPase subunit